MRDGRTDQKEERRRERIVDRETYSVHKTISLSEGSFPLKCACGAGS